MSLADSFNSQLNIETDQSCDNGMILNGVYLPIEIIQHILLCYADAATLLNCQQVCRNLNKVIHEYVWRRKAEITMGRKFASDVTDWKLFYLIYKKNPFNKNLLKNHSGEKGFKYWKVFHNDVYFGGFNHFGGNLYADNDRFGGIDNYGSGYNDGDYESDSETSSTNSSSSGSENETKSDSDSNDSEVSYGNSCRGWIVECPPMGAPEMPEELQTVCKMNCFVTTYYDCSKEYVIDLIKEGFTPDILDRLQPPIEVCFIFLCILVGNHCLIIDLKQKFQISEWYCARLDRVSVYKICVRLVNGFGRKIDEFIFDDTLKGEKQNAWHNVSNISL